MIQLLFGRAGSGKSTFVYEKIKEDLHAGKRVLLLLPEQASVNTEMRLSAFLSDTPTANLEILNFKRLSNLVFRQYGGLSYRYIGHGGKRLIMSRTLLQTAPMLITYANLDPFEKSVTDLFLSAVEELKLHRMTPEVLEDAELQMEKAGGNAELVSKLHDLGLILSSYNTLLSKEYNDPTDDPDRMNTLLRKNRFFAGMHVYLDGFFGFTPQQYETIRYIVRDADLVSVSLDYDPLTDRERFPFGKIEKTHHTLLKLFDSADIVEKHFSVKEGAVSPFLKYACDHLWTASSGERLPADDGSVRLKPAGTVLNEAEKIAKDIQNRVRMGASYRDCTVITRTEDRYEGIIDAVFHKYRIPFYFSCRSPITEWPMTRYFLTMFRLIRFSLRGEDVISLLKTGFSDLSAEDVCLFENYIRVWNLNGKDFDPDRPFTMHPYGYFQFDQKKTDETELLFKLNAIKEIFEREYYEFCDDIKGSQTVKEYAAAVFSQAKRMRIPEKLQAEADAEKLTDPAQAQKLKQIYKLFLSTLDILVQVCGEDKIDPDGFIRLWEMVLSDTDIGSVPTGTDEVTVGNPVLLRPDGCRYLYLIGCNDTVFPKTVKDDGIFTDAEKRVLERYCASVPDLTTERTEEEMFYFYSSAVCAKECLYLSWATADFSGKEISPCGVILHLSELLKINLKQMDETDPVYEIGSVSDALEDAAKYRDSTYGRALRDYFSAQNDETLRRRVASLSEPITERLVRLDEKTASMLFAGDLSMTQARLEKFVNCPLSFFCDYELKPKSYDRVEFRPVDTGNLTHEVLENYMKEYVAENDPDIYNDAYIADRIGELTDKYFERLIGFNTQNMQDKRLSYLGNKLKKTITLLATDMTNEFRQSEFVPTDFELSFENNDENNGIKTYTIPMGDGSNIKIYGKVDRVDTYHRNGKTYVRVVDYKTGSKTFKLDKIEKGLDMQMLLYLFAIWKNGEKRYGAPVEPAGVLYINCKTPDDLSESRDTADATERKIERSGLLLKDEDVLRAMEPELENKYIPVSTVKGGGFSARSSLATLEEFGKIREKIDQKVAEICTLIKSGVADAAPISKRDRSEKTSPCTYCEYQPICRSVRRKV